MDKTQLRHNLKTHSWVNGNLKTEQFFFELLKEAIEFGDNHHCDNYKVYDENGEVCYARNRTHHHPVQYA